MANSGKYTSLIPVFPIFILIREQFPFFVYVCVVCVSFCYVWLWNPSDCNLQTPLSVEFSRQKYWSGLLLHSPGNLPNPGIKPGSPALPIYSFTCSFIIRWIASTFRLLWIIFYGHGCLFEIRLLIILGMCPKVELLGHIGNYIFNLFTHWFPFSPAGDECFNLSTSWPKLVIFSFFFIITIF